MKVRVLFTALIATQLSGCFFFIPGVVIDKGLDLATGKRGEHCVSAGAKVGDHLVIAGKNYTVMALEGDSRRCRSESFPVRAVLRFDPEVPE